jgi:hypothetical protein
MRLLHPRTVQILATHADELPHARRSLASCWAEIFKWKASGQKHPKQFITDDKTLGVYLFWLWTNALGICNLDDSNVKKLGKEVLYGWNIFFVGKFLQDFIYSAKEFDDFYLFSDACSLYFKGCNIFPYIFGDEWRKYVPVESLKEIQRQVTKTLNK